MINMTCATRHGGRLRMPVGTDAEVYVEGGFVFADCTVSAVARRNALDIPGGRSWSPPV